MNKTYTWARSEGRDAVACRPLHAPRNPYDDEKQPELYQGWEDGAIEAGLLINYHNGVLIQ